MCCEHLICARCAGPVVEARCSACRATKAQFHGSHLTLSPSMLVVLIAALSLLTLLAVRHV
jgi:hypothetical protein